MSDRRLSRTHRRWMLGLVGLAALFGLWFWAGEKGLAIAIIVVLLWLGMVW